MYTVIISYHNGMPTRTEQFSTLTEAKQFAQSLYDTECERMEDDEDYTSNIAGMAITDDTGEETLIPEDNGMGLLVWF